MHSLRKIMFGGLLAATLALPLVVSAVPIGGKVVSVLPCPKSPGYIFVVAGFGVGTGAFWYLPGLTQTYLYTPPLIGQWVLGLSSPTPAACGTLPALMTGTSLGI
jgi:hypothetical protein